MWFSFPIPSGTTCKTYFGRCWALSLLTWDHNCCMCVCGCSCLRTKFVSDEWMVEKGFMESSVDEKDKWLGIAMSLTICCTPMLTYYSHSLLTHFLSHLSLLSLVQGGGMSLFPNLSSFSPLPYKALQLVRMPSKSSTRRTSIKCLCLMTRG